MSNILKYQNPSSPLLIQQVNQSGANFVKRLLDPDRKSIPDWETKGQKIATHKMSWGEDDRGAYVFPEVQEIDGQLIDFSRPPYAPGIADYMAHKNNNIIRMSPEEADWFTRNYKQYYPSFKKGGRIHIKKKNRGKFTAAAKRAGMGVQEFARHVLANKDKYSSTLAKRANFARNSKKFKHENGGILKVQEGTAISSERIPTLEEYIQMKQQEARQKALANSYNTTEPRLAKRYYSEEDLDDLRENLMDAEYDFKKSNEYAEETEKKLNHPFAPEHLFIFNPIYRSVYTDTGLNDEGEKLLNELSSDRISATLHKNYIKEYQDRLDYIDKHGYDWTGYGCITNATGWYGDPYVCASNIEFKKDPSKYGFVEISADDALPGDIFQYDERNRPNHATMYSKKGDYGEYYSNYSSGNYKDVIRHDSDYWGKGQRAFRFVGLPEDVEAWTREYNELYSKKFGGILDKFKKGGILKAQNGTQYGLPGGVPTYVQPKPFSPIDIAIKTAQARTSPTPLPPGVKEVVGPDGKTIVIRTEQPLMPLEQSVAEWLPGPGDVAEVGYIANDVKNGNYGSAALAAAMIALPGNVGKLLSKHRKAVSKTADAVEDAVRKADVSEYINTVDDALPERQPLTIQKSSQFWDGTSKSKLSVDEKMGLPKSERNQPIKSNPNAGVVTNVDTYLINRAYAPWEIRDGKFIFKMGEPINVRGLSERAPITFHFTTDTQVKPHSGGDGWANAKTTYLVPYKSVVKHNGMPANIEPMDTWWTAGSTFEFPTQDVKVLTADPKVYRQYKARGIDVEFSPEGRKLVRERKGMSDIVEQWIRSKQDQFGMRPTVDTYRQMERETGLSSNVRPKKKHLFGDYFEETNVPDYHTGPATHSNSWSFPAMANIGLPDDPKYFMSSIARNIALDLSKYKTFTFKDLPALQKLAQTHKQFDIQLPTTYGVKNEYSWDFSGQEELVDKINKILRGEIVVPYEQGGKL